MTSDDGTSLPGSGPCNRLGARWHRLDAMAVGRSILGPSRQEMPVEVRGYEVIRFAGHGGLGRVWQARRLSDGRLVALKLTQTNDPEMTERLAIEAETLRAMHHPHVVELLDLTTSVEGHPVLVMEWMDGPDLAVHLPDGGFDFDHALQLYLPVLEAVAHAHGLGIIHRDLKPSNILLTADGVPRVSDFGLARSLNQRVVAFSMTRSGAVAGTVEYLAPECYRADYAPSPAADIYALGVLLYELLSGTPPRGAWQPLSQIKPLDVRVDELIGQVMHPDPARRPRSALEIKQRLEDIRKSPPRLAGSPLITPAVRAADLAWTGLGLYVCAASFCATLSQTRTPVPALLDLRFSCTGLLISGFLAVWVLSLCLGVLSLWQIVRLWRFRHVPMRESLPQPFGARLGDSRLAACLVSAAQLVVLVLPLLFTLTVLFQAFHWWTPETPVWQRSLVLTPWMTDEPVSVWRWDPAAFVDGGKYWLKEADAGFSPGILRVHDKTSFFVWVQPALMVLAAVLTGICGLMTFVMALRQWWPHRRREVLLLGLLAGGSVASNFPGWRFDAARSVRDRGFADADRNGTAGRNTQLAEKYTLSLFRSLVTHQDPVPDPAILAEGFRHRFYWLDGVKRTPASLAVWAEQDRAASLQEERTTEALWVASSGNTRVFSTRHSFLDYRKLPGGTLDARFRRLFWQGKINSTGSMRVDVVSETTQPLYTAEPRNMTLTEARSWLDDFLKSLAAPDCAGLEIFFHPSVIVGPPVRVNESAGTIGILRAERNRWQQLWFAPAEPCGAPQPASGGRWQLLPRWDQTGVRTGGKRVESPIDFSPEIEVAWIGGSWRIVRFNF